MGPSGFEISVSTVGLGSEAAQVAVLRARGDCRRQDGERVVRALEVLEGQKKRNAGCAGPSLKAFDAPAQEGERFVGAAERHCSAKIRFGPVLIGRFEASGDSVKRERALELEPLPRAVRQEPDRRSAAR